MGWIWPTGHELMGTNLMLVLFKDSNINEQTEGVIFTCEKVEFILIKKVLSLNKQKKSFIFAFVFVENKNTQSTQEVAQSPSCRLFMSTV